MSAVEHIRDYLAAVVPGEVPAGQVGSVEAKLASCWDQLAGSGTGGMQAAKLIRRMENVEWVPPILKFRIERHGATVNGSTRADVQEWHVDVDRGTARLAGEKRRQLGTMDRRLDVKPIAAEIAALITAGREDPRLKWRGPNYVRIIIGEVIPTTFKQTTAGRRARFSTELARVLAPSGWHPRRTGSPMIYERADAVSSPPPAG